MEDCDCNCDNRVVKYLAIGGIVLALGIILLAVSWDTVEPIEFGLKCNSITKSCNQQNVFLGGRYLVGPFNYFINFPSTLQTIEFSSYKHSKAEALKTRTAEGLNLVLHVSFQYKLIREEIPDLYSMNNLDYENTFIRIARDIILQKGGQYEAPAYWLNRNKIAESMKEEMDHELRKAHAQCIYLQLLNIELPETYENSIVLTQVEVQKKKTSTFEQQAEMIRQEISILRSKTAQQINAINATAQADAYEIRQKAVAGGIQEVLGAEADAYKDFSTQTGINGKDISKYLFYNAIAGQKNSKLLVGVKNNIVST